MYRGEGKESPASFQLWVTRNTTRALRGVEEGVEDVLKEKEEEETKMGREGRSRLRARQCFSVSKVK